MRPVLIIAISLSNKPSTYTITRSGADFMLAFFSIFIYFIFVNPAKASTLSPTLRKERFVLHLVILGRI